MGKRTRFYGGRKTKLIRILQLLYARSDSKHPITRKQVADKLEEEGLNIEEKEFREDMLVLADCDIPIGRARVEQCWGYCIEDRLFTTAELKLLVDVVLSSRFLTEEYSRILLEKLGHLTNVETAKKLRKNIIVRGRVKSGNCQIFENIDIIATGIRSNRKIRFQYARYNLERKLEPRYEGAWYMVSPFLLVCDNENYYLVAYDDGREEMRHYRVDKILNAELSDDPREGWELAKKIDPARYTRENFSMFGGVEHQVTLEFSQDLIGVMFDRFGRDLPTTHSTRRGYLKTRIDVVVSPLFFSWLFSMENKVMIISPSSVREEYLRRLEVAREIMGRERF